MSEKSNRNPWRQILVIGISAAFLGTMIIPIVQSFTDSSNVATSNEQALQKQLQERAKGYEEVIKREPNNQLALLELARTRVQMNDMKGAVELFEKLIELDPKNQVALEGLAQTRILMEDAKGAIAPLEKLVKLYPENQEYKSVLEKLKQQVAQEGKQPKTESKK
jgi:cytochrome c-type biogenesis protein CcmH/NrfG